MSTEKLRIKEVLEIKDKSIQWLSDQLSITYANTNNIVNGKAKPSLDRLFEIAEILDVDVVELFRPQSGTIGIIRHNGKAYEINSIDDLRDLLEKIKNL